MFNSVTLAGNVGADPEIRVTQAGRKVAQVRLATSEKWRDSNSGETKEKTQWHNCVIWSSHNSDGLVKVVEQYVSKGSQILVSGKIEYRKYTDQQGVERWSTDIIVDTLKLLGKAAGSGRRESAPVSDEDAPPERGRRDDGSFGSSNNGHSNNGNGAGNGSGNGGGTPFDDEIPF